MSEKAKNVDIWMRIITIILAVICPIFILCYYDTASDYDELKDDYDALTEKYESVCDELEEMEDDYDEGYDDGYSAGYSDCVDEYDL